MGVDSEERMIHKAKDLSPDQRTAIESLIGQTLAEKDDSCRPGGAFARVDAQRQPVSDEEAEAIINEALRSTRPNYRPVR